LEVGLVSATPVRIRIWFDEIEDRKEFRLLLVIKGDIDFALDYFAVC
jgi:hypothetical protein